MEIRKSSLTESEIAGIRDIIEVSRINQAALLAQRREVIERFDPSLLRPTEEMVAENEESLKALEAAAAAGSLDSYLADMKQRTAEMADQGLGFSVIGSALVEVVAPVVDLLVSTYESEPERAIRALNALHMLENRFLLTAGSVYAEVREDTLGSEYQEMIRRLSTPVLPIWDEVLVMPLIGVIDSARAQQMMEQLLERISAEHARHVILDITGVPTVDTAVAEHLLKTTRAASLLGAEAVLVGMTPRVAQTLVRLGASLGEIRTFPDLRSGLSHTLRSLGYPLERGD